MFTKTLPANRKLIRDINENTLLNLIKINGAISRPQLARLSGLSLATISGITGSLIERGLVLEKGLAESVLGRKANLLEVNYDSGFVVGLKLAEEDDVTGVILNLNAQVVYQEHLNLPLKGNGERAAELLGEGIDGLLERSQINRDKLIGIGCGLPGFINGETGVCIESTIMEWSNVDLAQPLEKKFGIPVVVNNSVNSFVIYEKMFGKGQLHRHFLVVTIGRGVGLGIVINGDLYAGADGGAGEFGHTAVVSEGGRRCECGKYGCLEAYVADRGIVANYYANLTQELSPKDYPVGVNIEQILEKGRQGEVSAIRAFRQAGLVLGLGLANLVNLFNPELIILSGSGVVAADLLLEPLKEVLKQHTFSRLADNLQFIVEPASEESWAQGAGSLVLRQFFLPPVKME